MILSFRNRGTEDVYDGANTKAARRICPQRLWELARAKLDLVNFADDVEDLRIPPSNRLEQLSGDRLGQYSIRINRQYRICFYWTPQGVEEVEIVDYH